MNINFENIDYLKVGNDKQQRAYTALITSNILTLLQPFDPILVGTIPINIDIENSDLDIICYCTDRNKFTETIKTNFSQAEGFRMREADEEQSYTIIANFKMQDFEIEIFGQNIPTKQQAAYRHMIIENKLLVKHGEAFRQQIIDLKRQGYKTEPAFGMVLGLKGDPYRELLKYENAC